LCFAALFPDLSPIELCWSKLKQLLRSAKARTREALDQALTRIITECISADDALGWFAVVYSFENCCKTEFREYDSHSQVGAFTMTIVCNPPILSPDAKEAIGRATTSNRSGLRCADGLLPSVFWKAWQGV